MVDRYIGENGPDYQEEPHGYDVDDGGAVDFVVFPLEAADLGEREEGREDGVVGEEDVVEVDLARLVVADEVAVGVVEGVESEAGEVHGHKIEVHALDAG